jgi:hypothetical protein
MNFSDLAFLPDILVKFNSSIQQEVLRLHGIDMHGQIISYTISVQRPTQMIFSLGGNVSVPYTGTIETEIVYRTTDGTFTLYF